MSKRQIHVEWLPYDVIELILKRLPLKSLGRLKSVSKDWKSTIESPSFKQGQLICRMQSRGPDVLFMQFYPFATNDDDDDDDDTRRFEFGSSIAYTVRLPTSANRICQGSCDGLVCLYNVVEPSTLNVVMNPATRWHQSFPLSAFQHLLVEMRNNNNRWGYPNPLLGFGKDKIRGTYKPVWLYDSSEYGLDNVTTCEVFDFSKNAWRYVLPASPYPILAFQDPVHFDGSLYWLSECEETKVLSFDLHTETFQVISKAPFPNAPSYHQVRMCVLDNRFCVTWKGCWFKMRWTKQVIWWFDFSSGTWKEMCTIDLTTKTLSCTRTLSRRGRPTLVMFPIAIMEKNKLLLHQVRERDDHVVIYDLETKSVDFLFDPLNPIGSICYFESLLSL